MATRKRTDYIVVHVTATPPSRSVGAKEVDAMHKARGWSGIGYHYIIRRNGSVENGRPFDQIGAHVKGFNSVSVGVSLEGGVDEQGRPQDNRTAAQKQALEALLYKLVRKYPNATVCGHRDLSPDRDGDGIIEPHEYLKACPCFDAIPWANACGLPGAAIRGTWGSSVDPISPPEAPDDRIIYLQKLLKRAGYEFGPVDGFLGERTEAAIIRFQAAAGFPETGVFDEQTVARLREMFEKSRPPAETIVKERVPETVEKEVERKTGLWQWITGGGGTIGAAGAAVFGAGWETVAVTIGGALFFLILIIVLRKQIVGAVKEIRKATEG